jgi:hypothetical protein
MFVSKCWLHEPYLKGVDHIIGIVDSVFANLLKGLPILSLSIPSDFVPPWNEKNPSFVKVLFSFCSSFLDDDGTLFVFYLNDPSFLRDIMGFLSSNNFKIQQKWCMVNTSLKFSNPRDLLKMVFFFPPFFYFPFDS